MTVVTDMRLPAALVRPTAKPLNSNRILRDLVRSVESPFRQSFTSPYHPYSVELAKPGHAGPPSVSELHHAGAVSFTQLLIGREERALLVTSASAMCAAS